MLNIKEILISCDFNKQLQLYYDDYIIEQALKNYINKNGIDNLNAFSKEFWDNPSLGTTKLKKKYNIPNNISYSLILGAFPDERYIRFLKKAWDSEISIDNIIEEFRIPYDKAENLLQPIVFVNKSYFCPYCLESGVFQIEGNIRNIRNNFYNIRCEKCKGILNSTKLLSTEEVEEKKNEERKLQELFINRVTEATEKLGGLKCSKCQSEKLKFSYNEKSLIYTIECDACKSIWHNVDKLAAEYKEWKQRAAMMIAIRAKEQELIEKALNGKSISDVIIRKEQYITEQDSMDSIHWLFEQNNNDENEFWHNLYNNIKATSRAEKIVLLKLINICKEQGKKVFWQTKSEKVEVVAYEPKEPIIPTLFQEIGILNVRGILKRLINKKLIICCEEKNYVHITHVLIEHEETIRRLMFSPNINSDIRNIVFKRQSYSCHHCGETGRPLKVAFLSVSKNQNNLDSMIGICDICYDDITEDEVLIDGTIATDEFIEENDEVNAWKFLTRYLPEIKNDQQVHNYVLELVEDYDEEDVIKALAITIDKIKKGKIANNISGLMSYSRAVLKNSIDGVEVYKTIEKEYQIKSWTDRL